MARNKSPFTIYRIIRIDGEFNPERMSTEEAFDYAITKVVSDAKAHMHTIENGLQITGIQDCGESN